MSHLFIIHERRTGTPLPLGSPLSREVSVIRPSRGALLQFFQGDATVQTCFSKRLGQAVDSNALEVIQVLFAKLPQVMTQPISLNARGAWAHASRRLRMPSVPEKARGMVAFLRMKRDPGCHGA